MVGEYHTAKVQYREGYTRSLEGKEVEWDGDDNVEHMWKQVKQAMVETAREIIIIIWGISRSRQHSRCYITAEDKDALKIKDQT